MLAEDATPVDDKPGNRKLRLQKANQIGYRDLVLATKEVSLTIVGNAKTNYFPSGDL